MTSRIEEVRERVGLVDDPEFPGISIEDLGLVEDVRVDERTAHAEIDLVPTFLGCPALDVIATDVEQAVSETPGVASVSVRFVSKPVWSVERISPKARRVLATEYAVAVPGATGPTPCPVCASPGVEMRSPFGPTACRAVAYCESCRNPVEVMK